MIKRKLSNLANGCGEELAKQERNRAQDTIDLVNHREGQAVVPISSPLLSLLKRSITPECFGGIFVASP